MYKVSFIIPAAGSGSRMNSCIPKPFLQLAGKPVIFHTLENLTKYKNIVEIVVLLSADKKNELEAEFGDGLRKRGVSKIITGGLSRQMSVENGLAACSTESDLIAVHDAVRPFVNIGLLQTLFATAMTQGGALPILPITDTIKEVQNNVVIKNIPREPLVTVQTPQVFRRNLFQKAYKDAHSLGEEVTDDASLIEKAGGQVMGVVGSKFNIKLTTPEDLLLAEAFIKTRIIEGLND